MISFKCLVTSNRLVLLFVSIVMAPSQCQREPRLPVHADSFNQLLRSTIPVPSGRAANLQDVFIRFYGSNATQPSSHRLRDISRVFSDARFDARRPTVLYAHGYVELTTDKSVQRIVRSYLRNGGYNILVLDWANMAFGNYISVAMDVAAVGKETARAVSRLLRQGMPLEGVHFVGHSLGVHVLAYAARSLAGRGLKIPRLTGLDPAYPGFYPSLLGQPVSKTDASFVDIVHTDGGGYGAPSATGHADYWPNGGHASQPGCSSATLPLTDEDFCSHWRSWAFWAESVVGGEFLARRCDSYDSFLRGQCQAAPLVYMGLKATPRLTGLDPAYPGFYPSLLGQPVSKTDASFVDIVHTDGGGYGAPSATGHADYWPNGGHASQPGCSSATLPLTDEDFCSHWRSWAFWAESVVGGEFLARRCDSYDSFLRGQCQAAPLVYMGLKATPRLRGNHYLRTAAKQPYALGVAGAS